MKIEIPLDEMKESYDWEQAMEYAYPKRTEGAKCSEDPFGFDEIVEVIGSQEGRNDEYDWIAVFKLQDGRYAFLSAGCDYTGWDCQAGGYAYVSDDLENLVQFGLSNEARERLGA